MTLGNCALIYLRIIQYRKQYYMKKTATMNNSYKILRNIFVLVKGLFFFSIASSTVLGSEMKQLLPVKNVYP